MKNENTVILKNHPRINSVIHKYNENFDWEQIFESIIINHLKVAKRLD